MDSEHISPRVFEAHSTPIVGYLHTGFEKTMENRTYHQCVTYSNRMDYVNGFAHDLAYMVAIEHLMGARVPIRAQRIRVILNELNRIASHLVFFGTTLLDMGALTPFFYTMREREKLMDIFENVCGVRMNYGYFRVGGLRQDVPEEFVPLVRDFLKTFPAYLGQYDTLFMGNDILEARTRGVGVLTRQQAIDWCLTGPSLRASGVPLDFRKTAPYSGYEEYDFTWRDALEFLSVHSAYHFGRVVLLRQLLGAWPPPKEQ